MTSPLVTVICICYNHARFVEEAIQSVFDQTYTPIQLIVLDDASIDTSREVILDCLKDHPDVLFIRNERNRGHTRTFNQGINEAQGEFIIDLAGDDVLLPERIANGIKDFERASGKCGVHFSDAEWIDEEGKSLGFHSEKYLPRDIQDENIYKDLIHKYFICSPTMMFRKSVIDELGGYDEKLSYEDFDFWIRSSRNWNYWYSPEVLVKKRKLRSGHSTSQARLFSQQSESTYVVCTKIMSLNRTIEEQSLLSDRILYEVRLNLKLLILR
ncbi:MAG: glycosyltransferase [Flammeovirgaceae bacterium]|nr:glycosyltransferase [Flammeovirgaceae bacterium]